MNLKLNQRGIGAMAVIGLAFVGLIGLAVVLRVTSGQSFDQSPARSHGSSILGNSSANRQDESSLAPDFNLTTLDGRQITLSDYRGKKPVILDFFATWCPNCRRDMPKLNRLYEKYQDDIEVIAINMNESQKTVEKFIAEQGFSFPVAMDPGGRVSRSYGTRFTNTHVYIDKAGYITKTNYSDATERAIKKLIGS